MLIQEALVCFETQLVADGRSWHTLDQYRRHVGQLSKWLGSNDLSLDVEALTHLDLARFLADPETSLRADGAMKQASSMNCLRSSLRIFFRYLHEGGMTRLNSARLIRRAVTEPPPARALSPYERDRLIRVLNEARSEAEIRDRVLFRLLLNSGLRLGSALGMRIENMTQAGGAVLISVKGDRLVMCELAVETQIELQDFVGGRRQGVVFANKFGSQLGSRHIQRRFKSVCQRAGLPGETTPHSLRHTFARNLLAQTGDLGLVRLALCHQSLASTLRYVQADRSALRAALGQTHWAFD